jgi:signal transduction histidine kinase
LSETHNLLDDPDFWQTLDRLQGKPRPRQGLDAYHDLFHEVPLPIWVEDWSAVKRRLASLAVPADPAEFEDWLNGRPTLRLELYHLMPVIDTNAAATAFFGLRERDELIDRVMREPPEGSLEAMTHLIAAFLQGIWGLDWVLPAPFDAVGRPRWMRASCYLPPANRDCWSRVVYVTQDVTRQKQAEDALARAKSEADLANRAKSEFLANVSHELRTPLNAIAGYSDLLLEEKFGSLGHDAYRDYARVIRDSGEHLLDLINDLLDLSRAEVGVAALRPDIVKVDDVVGSALRLVEDRARRSGINITKTVSQADITVLADERKLRQILINLLDNAVKFSLPDGTIHIDCARDARGNVTLTVSDTGIGMSETEVNVALERFGRVDRTTSHSVDGAGLGLPLSKALTELHGGTLTVQSAPGRGTTITVSLPQDPPHGAAGA